ncbi:hypothetical protein NX02_15235 [Sphingomonas sanxanigenens DSM 19645 = NX02]|uniref:Addiction module antitoxin n=2 Tax=Sphingomonas sanxanigenens TaxID=397260 RepID=W0AGE9_9SPHN|nr:hypothetical protein NX02_15235 [Sphingomonas sanxanigenens DSM 19645 = NX02]
MDYISDDNPDAALKLKDDLDTRIETLLDRPKLYQAGRVAGTREMSMRRRYIVVYKEDETQVTILRVLHAAQQWPH